VPGKELPEARRLGEFPVPAAGTGELAAIGGEGAVVAGGRVERAGVDDELPPSKPAIL